MSDSYLRSSFHRSGESPQWRKNERCAIMHIYNRRRLCKNGVPYFFFKLFFSHPFSTNLSSKTAGLSNWVYPFSQNNDWRRKFTFLLESQIAKKVSHMTITNFCFEWALFKNFRPNNNGSDWVSFLYSMVLSKQLSWRKTSSAGKKCHF